MGKTRDFAREVGQFIEKTDSIEIVNDLEGLPDQEEMRAFCHGIGFAAAAISEHERFKTPKDAVTRIVKSYILQHIEEAGNAASED